MRTLNAQVSTHERFAHINMFYLNVHFVLLAIGGLAALEAAARAEEGRG